MTKYSKVQCSHQRDIEKPFSLSQLIWLGKVSQTTYIKAGLVSWSQYIEPFIFWIICPWKKGNFSLVSCDNVTYFILSCCYSQSLTRLYSNISFRNGARFHIVNTFVLGVLFCWADFLSFGTCSICRLAMINKDFQ